jgi:lipid-binding SYLF domain-containing protein
MRFERLSWMIAGAVLAAGLTFPAAAQGKTEEAEKTLAAARTTLNHFLSDPDMKWLKEHFKEAKGILIVPNQNKGGFIFAGSGGVGVLFTRDGKGGWNGPAYYRLGSVSVGFQIGGEHSEVLLFIHSKKGADSFLASSFKLGGEASVAAGPVGQGAQAATADVLSFSRSKGAFVGASLEGTVIKPAEDLNEGFYGKELSPVDILVRGEGDGANARPLKKDIETAAGR